MREKLEIYFSYIFSPKSKMELLKKDEPSLSFIDILGISWSCSIISAIYDLVGLGLIKYLVFSLPAMEGVPMIDPKMFWISQSISILGFPLFFFLNFKATFFFLALGLKILGGDKLEFIQLKRVYTMSLCANGFSIIPILNKFLVYLGQIYLTYRGVRTTLNLGRLHSLFLIFFPAMALLASLLLFGILVMATVNGLNF